MSNMRLNPRAISTHHFGFLIVLGPGHTLVDINPIKVSYFENYARIFVETGTSLETPFVQKVFILLIEISLFLLKIIVKIEFPN
jgi:hypothetical protein